MSTTIDSGESRDSKTDTSAAAFLEFISKEIRAELNTVTSINNLLLETELSSEQHDYIETVQRSGETLLTLVNDLIEFSLVETGKLQFDALEFDLRTAVEDAMEVVAYRALAKAVQVHTLIHASVPEKVKGDPTRLRQILVNLAGNAVLFSECGEVALTVKAVEEHTDTINLRFEVSRFGCRMTEEQLHQLFTPFSNADAVTSLQYGKTGLELALSKRLVQLMGGQIGLSTVPGKGSVVWFSLVLKKCAPVSRDTAISSPVPLNGMRILIADPSSSGRQIIAHYLEEQGCSCSVFDRSDALLAELEQSPEDSAGTYDAMIVALQQVGSSGFEQIIRLKESGCTAGIPLVLVIALGRRGDARKIKEGGVTAYLTRPLKQYQLIECMRMIRKNASDAKRTAGVPLRHSLITRHTIAEERTTRKIRILVADDNAGNRVFIKKVLDAAGYSCDLAENGVDAVESVDRNGYDGVFMDCQMPIMNGFEAAKTIRAAANENTRKNTGMPICAMVTRLTEEEVGRCMNAGMEDHIEKPVKPDTLLEMVRKWEQNRAAARAGNREPDTQNSD